MAINDPKGNLVTVVGTDPDGNPKALLINAAGELKVTGGGAMQTDDKARYYLSSAQDNIPTGTLTKVLIDGSSYDPNSLYNSNDFKIKVAGYYDVKGCVGYKTAGLVADKAYFCSVQVGATVKCGGIQHSSHVGQLRIQCGDVFHCDADDVIAMYTYHQAGANTPDLENQTYGTYLVIHLFSAD